MDSPKQLHPAWAPGSSQMFPEEHSQEGSGKSDVPFIRYQTPLPSTRISTPAAEREKKPQGLVDRILSNNRKRSGVRTLLTARKERMERMIPLIQYQRYLNKRSMGESRVERFRCACHYCLYPKDVSEDTSMENNDTEPM
ncbi:unnamed protein product [Nyctereutes procyonoides]|uniref:(raccoon dog) hypothetical protein n=1 Tax=Nyctereutes procyonoides TaxID=34880 RepID=A0A811YU99_NYCPR|nr:unnamed protein product [Nyctereutes procyonoides]